MAESTYLPELHKLAAESGGQIRPSQLVEAARSEDSPLHSWFQWDDSEAAQQHRLWQARQLLRVTVQYIGEGDQAVSVRAFVSLTTDRNAAGGYRVTATVMANPKQREQLLADAIAEMQRFEKKYSDLKELAGVLTAMRKVSQKKPKAA